MCNKVKRHVFSRRADPDLLENIDEAVDAFEQNAVAERGRLRILPPKLVRFSFPYRFLMNRIIDPYGGPREVPR